MKNSIWIIATILAILISISSIFIAFAPEFLENNVPDEETQSDTDVSGDTDAEVNSGSESDTEQDTDSGGAFDGPMDPVEPDEPNDSIDTDTSSDSENDGGTDEPITLSFDVEIIGSSSSKTNTFIYEADMTFNDFISSGYNDGRFFIDEESGVVFYDVSYDTEFACDNCFPLSHGSFEPSEPINNIWGIDCVSDFDSFYVDLLYSE